jgi:hypothetical protein
VHRGTGHARLISPHRHNGVLAVVSVVAVALIVRFVLLFDRAANDANFYHLVEGSDNYVGLAQAFLSGDYRLGGTYYQPGNVIWLAAIMSVLGSDMWTLYVIDALVGALSVGAVIGTGWIAFGKRIGLVGGLIAALYPPLIFFHTTLQPAALATVLAAVAMLAGMWAVHCASKRGAALFGIATGLGALARPTLLVLGPAFVLALVVARDRGAPWRGWQPVLVLTVIAAVLAVLALAPQILANRSAGSADLISSNGPVNLYFGNNRDTDGTGINNRGQASYVARARHDGWIEALEKDLKADPGRMIALMLRKVGLFWGNGEVGNNVDYYTQGMDASPLLRTLALDGILGWTALSWLALTGVFLLLHGQGRDQKTAATWLVAGIGSYMLGTVLVFVISRLRIVIAPFLCVAAGIAVSRMYRVVRTRRIDRPFVQAGGLALALMLVFYRFERYLPRKEFYGALPSGAFACAYNFGDEIELVGMEAVESDYRPGGYAYVTLYWQAISPPTADYSVFVHLVDLDGHKVAGHDERILGSITYPVVGTSRWPVGTILAESYLIDLPEDMPSVTNVYAGVYHPDTLERLAINLPDGTPTTESAARITAFGVIPPDGFPVLTGTIEAADFRVGDSLHIIGKRIPATMSPGETLEMALQWEATGPLQEDYTVFFHLFDVNMDLVAQSDVAAFGLDLPSSAMVPGHPIGVSYSLNLPEDIRAGEYLLRMGVYTYPSFERLPVRDDAGRVLPNGLIDLAVIQVE